MDTPKIKARVLRYLYKNEGDRYLDIRGAFTAKACPAEAKLRDAGEALVREGFVAAKGEGEDRCYQITPEGNAEYRKRQTWRIATGISALAVAVGILGFTLKDVLPFDRAGGVGDAPQVEAVDYIGPPFTVTLTSDKAGTTPAEVVVLTAVTTQNAESVLLFSRTEENTYGPERMHTQDSMIWSFRAEFFEEGTHTVWVEAAGEEGPIVSNELTITVYP